MSDLTRRTFLQKTSLGALAAPLAAELAHGEAAPRAPRPAAGGAPPGGPSTPTAPPTMIGAFGPWAATVAPDPPTLSFRRDEWSDIDDWRAVARGRLLERLAQPETGGPPPVTVHRTYDYQDLHVEELTWQLPYGPPTQATLLKPKGARGRLPGILALHDHSADKYFGRHKLTRTSDDQHPMMVAHQENMYEGRAWANEIARLGYVVLVPDAFGFASRRVRLEDVPEKIRYGAPDHTPPTPEGIEAYNLWARQHEHVMGKALFSAGTSWPGVFLAEDQRALDVLCARPDVDPDRVGCGGLSGGGLRAGYLGGADSRIRCAVPVGMMTTWDDFALNKCHTHTWMIYIPVLPRELDFPEVLGLRVPLPTLVLNNREDPLFTMAGMRRADEILREVYAKAGASERYRCSFYPGPHKFDRAMQEEAFAWFERWM